MAEPDSLRPSNDSSVDPAGDPADPAADPAGDGAADRRRTVVVAGHGGDLGTVRSHRNDPDPQVRAASVGALDRLSELDEADLVTALNDPSSVVARRAITAAAGRTASTAKGPLDHVLVRLVEGGDPELAEHAAWAIGERWEEIADHVDDEVVAAIERVARGHADALVREAAVAALGSIGATRSLPVILAAAADKATVRRRAVIALAPFDGPEVDAALAAARVDRDWQVRQAAEDLLAP